MGSPPGALRNRPTNTARGTPWVWRTCGFTDFGKPRCREVSRSAGPSGPLASRAPSAFSESAGELGLRAYPALAQKIRAMTHVCAQALNVLAAVDVNLGAVHIRACLRAQHVDDLG